MSNAEKTKLLGMPFGTANARLRKAIMFSLVQRLGLDICCRCGKQIETVIDVSMDHIIPWQNAEDPIALFFDLDNIAFSHLSCNISAAVRTYRKYHTDEEIEALIEAMRVIA